MTSSYRGSRSRSGFSAPAGSGYRAVYYGVFCLLLGVPVDVWVKVRRGVYGTAVVR